jgi:hypothetical protein
VGHENNRGTVGDCDLYSVLPEIIKEGHRIGSALSNSVVREFRKQINS